MPDATPQNDAYVKYGLPVVAMVFVGLVLAVCNAPIWAAVVVVGIAASVGTWWIFSGPYAR